MPEPPVGRPTDMTGPAANAASAASINLLRTAEDNVLVQDFLGESREAFEVTVERHPREV